ncbi:hypothetical protein SLEP1_g23223 [Rubroshorea leprosula]|uniref:RNase H type-1 domain-containing protein n=1 Tax=Rubroshorea leprosula TaxID=152421 RepID=A0AAV5JKG7_9ROSI|nr:hypothetical protein SLEP1_g23223 [Rubroshorea leprosula]
MSRFNNAVLEVSSFDQAVGIAVVILGLNHERFRDSLIKHPATTFNENQNPDWKDENPSRKRMRTAQNRGPMSTSTLRFERLNSTPSQQSVGKPPVTWTPLNLSRSQIFMQIKNKMDLRRPGPMRTAAATRDHTRYCDFHQDHGHTTEQCNSLRSKLESLAQKGMLNEYIQRVEQPRFVREQSPQPQGICNPPNRQGLGHQQALPPLPPPAIIIHMITGGLEAGGLSSKQRKLYVREVKHQNRAQKRKLDDTDWKDQPITFTLADFEGCSVSSGQDAFFFQRCHWPAHINRDPSCGARPQKNRDQPAENPPLKIHDNQQVMEVEILDNRPEDETRAAPGEDVEKVQIDEKDSNRKTQIGTQLSPKERAELIAFLQANKDVFAWTSADMPGIPTSVSQHKLSTNSLKKPVAQKRCLFGGERLKVIKEEVEKLLQADFVKRVDYCGWVANLVLVKKANGKWRMYIDYTNLNQACPKDCYPMPNMDKLVETTSGNERLSLLDAYSGYHQVPMALGNEEKTVFYAGDEIYCYVMMPFGLKNAGANYQKMVTIVFRAQIGFMVSRRGIEVNPEKIKAMAEMEPPKSMKDVQRLTGRVATLHKFISKSADKCLPFSKIMRLATQKDESGKQKKFEWNSECQAAFDELKSYLSSPPLLTKANDGEILYLYLGISDESISSVLVREEGKQQKPVYYTSNFIVECTSTHSDSQPTLDSWILYVDGASSNKGSDAGAILLGPDGYRSEYALKFNFDATNNMAEYEALLLYLQLAIELKVTVIQTYSDSQLVVNQVNSVCEVVDLIMMKYATLVAELKSKFQKFRLNKIPQAENEKVDSLSKFASDGNQSSRSVFVEILDEPNFLKPKMMEISTYPSTPSWTDPIISFLRDGTVLADKQEEMRLRKKASRYTLVNEVLYKRSFSLPLLRCLNSYEAEYTLREVHEGVCGSHIGARTLAHKVLRQGYYWPNMYKDATQFV